ncbi:MAG: hypothetical protein AABX79_03030 [Nanoarchaeota archaeon]
MILSALKVLELNEEYGLVEGLGERDAKNPEGVGLDLRVGEVHRLTGDSLIGIEKRLSPKTEKIASLDIDGNKEIMMEPGEYLLVTTMETIHSPKEKVNIGEGMPPVYLMPVIYPRSSLQRGGIALLCTKTDPGYKGKLTFGLKNLSNQDFEFELGARMFNLVFEAVIGDINRPYTGQHQGGRVTSEGKEEKQT